VTATATGAAPISVQFNLDGALLGSPANSSPYSTSWDTTGFANGVHSLSCTTTNTYGETTTGSAVSVTVNNDSTPPVRSNGFPSTNLPSGTTSTTLSLVTNENASCKYSTTANTLYASMVDTFTTTGTITHSTTVTGLTDNTTYTYYVRCQDVVGNSNIDDLAITFSVLTFSSDSVIPSTPLNVISTPAMASIGLVWDASTDNIGVTGYKIFRNSVQIATVTNTHYTDTSLSPNTAYTYEIAAYDAAANTSLHSGIVNTSTLPDTEAPSVPQSLIATPTSNTTVALTWAASTDNVAVSGYKIFRNNVQIGTSTGLLFNDANLIASTAYLYEVSAYDTSAVDSSRSTSATTTTPALATTATTTTTQWTEEKKKKAEKPKRTLKQSTSAVARWNTLTQSGKRFAKNSQVKLYFQKPNSSLYFSPLLVNTNSKGEFSISYKVTKPAGKYSWYAVEVRSGRKSPKRTYTVYESKTEAKPVVKKNSSSSKNTHSS